MIPHVETATIDFETRSACSLRACGSWKYSCDPSTEILCLAWRLPFWEPGRTALWHPEFRHLGIPESPMDEDVEDLLTWIASGLPIEAHNAFFERGIWTNILTPKHSWPPIPPSQWRCSAAKAAAHALPRGLEDAVSALHLSITKDAEGAKLMKKITKPRKPRKAEREAWTAATGNDSYPLCWWEDRESFERLWAYCRQDVLAEEALSMAVPDLHPEEHELYLLDQTMNERGFQLDVEGVDIALDLIAKETLRLNKELRTLTDGMVAKATQRDKMKDWFMGHGLDLPDTQKGTIDGLLGSREIRRDLSPTVWRGLELVRALGRSSTAKYVAMRNWTCPDHRAHGGLLFHGASTGRWSGAGVQPQNFVRGTVKDIEALWAAIRTRSRKVIEAFCPDPTKLDKPFGDVMTALSQALRGAIIAAPGKQLYVADYASIEARVLLWLAQDEEALEVFRKGEDIYCVMASAIYGYPCNKKDHPFERALGKVAILGLGYQMGAAKFVDTALVMGGVTISDEMAEQVVAAYREKFWRVKQMWWDQEAAAIEAMSGRGKRIHCGRMTWVREGDYLYCVLPSGRRLAYPFPEVRMRQTPWGAVKGQLTFKGINPYTRKWERQSTYGGMLVENQTQAVARDLMAEAMKRAEQSEHYRITLSVHDELIAEAPLGVGDVKEFEQLMAACPDWAEGCPVEAEGWRGVRYRK